MIGLEYIVKEFHMSFTDVARLLGITRKSITNWTKGWQTIPNKHLGTLSEYFGVNATYFQKELSEAEKLEIQLIKIKRENIDDNNLIFKINEEIEMEKLFQFLREQVQENETYHDILQGVEGVFKLNNPSFNKAMLVFVSLLKNNSDWGGDPFYGIQEMKLAEELYQVLINHKVIFE